MGWHVEGDVLLRTAYQYGSTRLARLHWSGVQEDLSSWTVWFETRSTAAHPERDMIQLWSGAQHVFVFVFLLRARCLWFVALPLHGCCVLGERVPKMVR